MQKASPKVFHLSGRILRSQSESVPPTPSAAVLRQALESLLPRLVPLVGADGYCALLSRALTLAKREYPRSTPLHLNSERMVAGLEYVSPVENAGEDEAACCAILAFLLSLLTSFLGMELTRQMVSGAWPHVAGGDTDLLLAMTARRASGELSQWTNVTCLLRVRRQQDDACITLWDDAELVAR